MEALHEHLAARQRERDQQTEPQCAERERRPVAERGHCPEAVRAQHPAPHRPQFLHVRSLEDHPAEHHDDERAQHLQRPRQRPVRCELAEAPFEDQEQPLPRPPQQERHCAPCQRPPSSIVAARLA